MSDHRHLIGLLLGTEEDWPTAFETMMRRLGPVVDGSDRQHHYDVERVTIEPFELCARPRHELVIDRLAYWYYHPREWLKKVALMDDVYLLNSPFTFQSMEKHAAYCAMLRLGLHVPETVLIPYKNPPENARYAFTAEKYNKPFDLDAIAESIGYPLFMKPYDGGAWVGVSMIRDSAELHRAYDESGQRLMHLQKAVSGYRGLRAEPVHRRRDDGHEVRPRPAHARPVLGRARLPGRGHRRGDGEHRQARQRLLPLGVQLLRDADPGRRRLSDRLRQRLPGHRADQPALLLPVGAEGARPVVGLLHRHRTAAAVRPGHPPVLRHRRPDRPGLRREAPRLPRRWPTSTSRWRPTRTSAPAGWPTSTRSMLDWVRGPDFDRLLVDTVRSTFPAHEHDHFIEHYRGLLGLWMHDEENRLRLERPPFRRPAAERARRGGNGVLSPMGQSATGRLACMCSL